MTKIRRVLSNDITKLDKDFYCIGIKVLAISKSYIGKISLLSLKVMFWKSCFINQR